MHRIVIATLALFAGSAQASQPTPQEAARFLTQATYGPTIADIRKVQAMGYDAWITQQFATPPMDSHWVYAEVRHGPIGCKPCTAQYVNAVMESFWKQAVQGPDQLRQRVVLALSEIFVVSTVNSAIEVSDPALSSYLDLLAANAFGNYETLLRGVSTHPAMSQYLTFFQNLPEDPATGRIPDENYAREVMQLFTIGLWKLNADGTRATDSHGNDIPTYGQADVSGMAKVFTGWSWNDAHQDKTNFFWNPVDWHDQLSNYPAYSSTSEKDFLGHKIPEGVSGPANVARAVKVLFNHPNAGPFFANGLIKRLVTSNPSPAYVGRVAAAFDNNGAGVRGDMQAVIRAVLLDTEARDDTNIHAANWGKLREPIIRYGNFLRSFGVVAKSGAYQIWNLEDPVYGLGQNELRASSVFNFFRPDYAPPGAILDSGLTAPEFQITDETTVAGYANFMASLAERQTAPWAQAQNITDPNYLQANYTTEMRLAADPQALLSRVSLLLTAGEMSRGTFTTILAAINAVPATDPLHRVATAVLLTMLSPDYVVQK